MTGPATPALLTPGDDGDAAVARRLDREPIIWVTTVSADHRPHSVPVWFHWADPFVTIFSRPSTAKVRRLRGNPAVSLSLDSAAQGADIVLAEGDAGLVSLADVAPVVPEFERKYLPMLGEQPIGQWLETFSQPVVVTVRRLVAWRATPEGLDHRSLPR
ncbi:pyridoxamine 5'-phosphate oxidase family protein [Pseudonocardia sp. KRD291]|uniref:pyridoxamine 5'-phosphate oxidase family protein n=1 Tax=Pseudonocardia sp. KRD291 TaxID=2792007 RepID=UPI001C4A09E3|nr:pyridoxamine 5'-phosphate oxidase family protein [Pseudonocardia sp. KRD291]MBW0106575.1 pyridoxamine 5'-phosphate oxidase family protein [Pseudonocardia sp. KRD291]